MKPSSGWSSRLRSAAITAATDAASVEACLEICLPQLRAHGLVLPE